MLKWNRDCSSPWTSRVRRGGVAVGGALLTLGLVACVEDPADAPDIEHGASTALEGVTISQVTGNPTCGVLSPSGVNWIEFKIDESSVAKGVHTDGYIVIEISNLTDHVFDWTSNHGIDAVLVKGGPGGNLYTYVPESLGGEGLTSVRDKDYSISHISFCYDIESARISIEPDAVNEIGDAHTFTVLVEQRVGDTGDWAPVAVGTQVLVALDELDGADAVLDPTQTTCDVDLDANGSVDFDGPGTDANGECTVTFTSATSGIVVAHASASPMVGSALEVETGSGEYDSDGTKRFVDASLTIGDDAINGVGEPHTFTVEARIDDGNGEGLQPPPDGTQVLVELTSAGGASAVLDPTQTTCDVDLGGDGSVDFDGLGTVGGACTVTFVSDTPGTVTGHAVFSWDFDNEGGLPDVTVTRETGTEISPDAVKTYVDGAMRWLKVDASEPPLTLAGAVFEVCRTHDYDSETLSFVVLMPAVCADVEDCTSAPCDESDTFNDTDPQGGAFLLTGLPLGRYSVRETTPPAGYTASDVVQTPEVTSETEVVLEPFVNVPEEQEELSGCSLGFWKTHTSVWTGYAPTDRVADVFGIDPTSLGLSANLTLLEALRLGGGGGRKLLRQAVAALLNLSSGYAYPGAASEAALIAAVQQAFATGAFEPLAGDLDTANNFGCLLD